MKLGFVIDQTRCIGCHACTVACKSENNVPVDVFRTWVKYIEKGEFPDTRRYFAVLRCNQCDDAPCISICPTKSLYRRGDGIVDFDSSRCIGCKSCMQACPYDALYIDPLKNTAAKCHFCAHRTEQGLEPACAVVCPTNAIIAGDLDEPQSRISRIIKNDQVVVRKPFKNTRPKVYYKGVDQTIINPDKFIQDHSSMMTQENGQSVVELQGERITYQAKRASPWGIKIATYLWTKSLASGVLLAPILFGGSNSEISGKLAPLAAFTFLVLTGLLLVLDLKRPERFLYILFKPNFSSWLVLGTYMIMIYGCLILLWFIQSDNIRLLNYLKYPTALFAILTACYSAFLFHQARGRDLWLSKFLIFNLFIAALLAGAALFSIFCSVNGEDYHRWFDLDVGLMGALLFIVWIEKNTHKSPQIERSLQYLFNTNFYFVVILAGFVVPVSLWCIDRLVFQSVWFAVISALCTLVALFEYERLWIKAGQSVPLS